MTKGCVWLFAASLVPIITCLCYFQSDSDVAIQTVAGRVESADSKNGLPSYDIVVRMLASHPAAPGSILSIPKNVSLDVAEIY